MKVWVVLGRYAYEGDELHMVCSTRERADAVVSRLNRRGHVCRYVVVEAELDVTAVED